MIAFVGIVCTMPKTDKTAYLQAQFTKLGTGIRCIHKEAADGIEIRCTKTFSVKTSSSHLIDHLVAHESCRTHLAKHFPDANNAKRFHHSFSSTAQRTIMPEIGPELIDMTEDDSTEPASKRQKKGALSLSFESQAVCKEWLQTTVALQAVSGYRIKFNTMVEMNLEAFVRARSLLDSLVEIKKEVRLCLRLMETEAAASASLRLRNSSDEVLSKIIC
jgi:hypothetical protein